MNVVVRTRVEPRATLHWLVWAAVALAFGISVALPEPLWLVVGAVGLAAVTLAVIQPLLAIPLLLFAVPFGGLARGGGSSDPSSTSTDLSFGAAELLVVLLAVVWLARGVRRHQLNVRGGAIVVVTLAMIALALLSIGYANDRPSAIKESLKWLELLLTLIIVVDLAHEAGAMRLVIGAMLVAGAAEAAFGAIQVVTGSGPATFALQGSLRAFGHFDQPNPFAGYLTTMLPLAVCMTICPTNARRFRWLAAGTAGLLTIGIALSQSRGAWLGGAIAALCVLLAWSGWTRRLLIPTGIALVLAVILAVSGVLPPSILDRLSQAVEYFGVFDVRTVEVNSDNWAVVERMAHWQAGWYMFVDHPWLGVGAGNYADAYATYFVGSWREALGHAHNYYLNMLAELGIVGGAVLSLLLGSIFRQFGGGLVRSEEQNRTFARAVLGGVFGGLIVFCVHNMFDDLFVHSVNIQIGVLLGLGLVAVDQLRSAAASQAAT